MKRSVAVNYCDDIRTEVGNKVTLVGLYGAELLVSELPAVLPKFCLFVQIFNNLGEVFDGELTFKLTYDDELLFEQKLDSESRASEKLPDDLFEKRIFQLIFAPFAVAKEGVLRTRIFFGSDEYRGAGLRIRAAPQPS